MRRGNDTWLTPTGQRLLIIIVVVALSLILELVVHYYFGIAIIYTHAFYPILILAGYWYHRKAVYLGLLFAAIHILIEYVQVGALDPGILVRAAMFVIVGFVVGYLFERLERSYAGRPAYQQLHYSAGTSGAEKRTTGNADVLITRLRSRNPETRYTAAEALGELHDPRAVEPLAAILADGESGVRWKAAESLGKMGDAAVEPLISSLSDENEDVRWMAALALGEIGNPQAVQPLLDLLNDRDPYVRSRAAIALGKIGEPAEDALREALLSGNDNLRWGAALAFGKIGSPSAVAALIGALQDPDEHVRSRAAEALGEIGDPAVQPLIAAFQNEDSAYRTMIAKAFRAIGKPAVAPLDQALKNEDERIRNGAALALAMMDIPESTDALLSALDSGDERMKQAARNALRTVKKK